MSSCSFGDKGVSIVQKGGYDLCDQFVKKYKNEDEVLSKSITKLSYPKFPDIQSILPVAPKPYKKFRWLVNQPNDNRPYSYSHRFPNQEMSYKLDNISIEISLTPDGLIKNDGKYEAIYKAKKVILSKNKYKFEYSTLGCLVSTGNTTAEFDKSGKLKSFKSSGTNITNRSSSDIFKWATERANKMILDVKKKLGY